MAHSAAHCLRSGGNAVLQKPAGEFPISSGLPIGDLLEQLPYRLAEHAALRRQRRQGREGGPFKIGVQPFCRLPEYRKLRLLCGIATQGGSKVFLPLQPQPSKRLPVRSQEQISHRRGNFCHIHSRTAFLPTSIAVRTNTCKRREVVIP